MKDFTFLTLRSRKWWYAVVGIRSVVFIAMKRRESSR